MFEYKPLKNINFINAQRTKPAGGLLKQQPDHERNLISSAKKEYNLVNEYIANYSDFK